jgi:hypothetical protein
VSVLDLAAARARGIALPADDDVAQDILDEVEGWLERFLGGPLTGSRTETFYVGHSTHGKLYLARYTDAVTVEDNGVAVAATQFRLLDRGSAIGKDYHAASWYWTGPYVEVTYEPNDDLTLSSIAYQLLGLEVTAPTAAGGMQAETIGSYSYQRSTQTSRPQGVTASRQALAQVLIPQRDTNYTLSVVGRRVGYDRTGVINAAELPL